MNCFGQEIREEDYPELFKVLGMGSRYLEREWDEEYNKGE